VQKNQIQNQQVQELKHKNLLAQEQQMKVMKETKEVDVHINWKENIESSNIKQYT